MLFLTPYPGRPATHWFPLYDFTCQVARKTAIARVINVAKQTEHARVSSGLFTSNTYRGGPISAEYFVTVAHTGVRMVIRKYFKPFLRTTVREKVWVHTGCVPREVSRQDLLPATLDVEAMFPTSKYLVRLRTLGKTRSAAVSMKYGPDLRPLSQPCCYL